MFCLEIFQSHLLEPLYFGTHCRFNIKSCCWFLWLWNNNFLRMEIFKNSNLSNQFEFDHLSIYEKWKYLYHTTLSFVLTSSHLSFKFNLHKITFTLKYHILFVIQSNNFMIFWIFNILRLHIQNIWIKLHVC